MAKDKTEIKETIIKDLVFVNPAKVLRAKEILALVARQPKTEEEAELKAKFVAMMANDEVNIKGDDTLEYIYTKLGGLIRTKTEQIEVDKKAEKLKANKKVVKEEDSE